MFLRLSLLECGDSSPLCFLDTTWTRHSTSCRTEQPNDPVFQVRPHIDMRRDFKQYGRGMASMSQRFQEPRPIEVAVTDVRLDASVSPLLDVNHRDVVQ